MLEIFILIKEIVIRDGNGKDFEMPYKFWIENEIENENELFGNTKKVKEKMGLHGNRTRDLSHPKRESYH